MKRVLITGASGFLGRHTVDRFRRIHPTIQVRAMIRPPTSIEAFTWAKDNGIEVARADLSTSPELSDVMSDVDAVVHLAAVVRGSDAAMQAGTVEGTKRLLKAMNQASIKHLILCSSFSVYNYNVLPVGSILTEDTPLLDGPSMARRNSYTIAKTQQERLVREWADSENARLTVLRPGFIWGPGHVRQPFLVELGPLTVAIGPKRHLPLSYVDNCADAFVTAAHHPHAIGETFHVVDREDVTPLQYIRDTMTPKTSGVTLPIPYNIAFSTAWIATQIQEKVSGVRLPSILHTHRFEPRFKQFRVHKEKLQQLIGWSQPISYKEAVRRV
ncbi:MAG: NAD-dependent epimerase/dehydratase family protein [Myxococcales bacterium]|nr:NAD-dependent epimerase/dehydratase family protein [Myxococcales bacterium]